jgi:hypothetical protein
MGQVRDCNKLYFGAGFPRSKRGQIVSNIFNTISAMLSVLVLMSGIALADAAPGFENIVERLRTSFQSDLQMPLDRELYADNLLVTHNYDPGGPVDTAKFLAGVGRELKAAQEAGLKQSAELTRFLVADDTIVATVLQSGTLKSGASSRFYIAYFFKVEDGRVSHIETWYDRKASEQELEALRTEMKAGQ